MNGIFRYIIRNNIVSIGLILIIVSGTLALASPSRPVIAQKEHVTLRAMLDNLADPGRWNGLLQPALKILRDRHPEADIELTYTESPYNETRGDILEALQNHSSIDLVSVDQIWLGDFAGKGLLSDLTNWSEKWGRYSDWYQANWDGGSYNKKIYGIWTWTDVRGIWYWKDLLKEANVDPSSLMTWTGYLNAAKKLNDRLEGNGSEGMYLVAASHSPDLWYPYLWMLGGDILGLKGGHPTRGTYWFPTYNSSQGVRALEFLKEQENAGIRPQVNAIHQAQDFVSRKFAVSIDGSWVPGQFPQQQRAHLQNIVGFLPMFPISSNETNQTTTLMGGWELAVPASSSHKDLAWELITIIVQPQVLKPWLLKYGYLPTQSTIGEDYIGNSSNSFPYYDKMISMIPYGHVRPSIPEYPLLAQDINQAINEVLFKGIGPKEALQIAAEKSAKNLGWG